MTFPFGLSRGDIVVSSEKWMWADGRRYRCALGAAGVSPLKSEGDKATPSGRWPIRYGLYRADRLAVPRTDGLRMYPLSPRAGWCDDPDQARYNSAIRFPFEYSAERLWRFDALYDIIIVLGYNDNPVVPKRGSAIFLHVARANFTPTEGCVALAKSDLLRVLRSVTAASHITIMQ